MRPIAVLIATAFAAACVPSPVTIVASPSPSATASPTASPFVSPSPTADPRPFNVATAVGTIPQSFHYFDIGQGASYRILLFDEDKTDPPTVVLTSGQPPVPAGPDVRSDGFSVSADGRVMVVMRRLSPQQTTYYVVRPETGELRTLFSGADLGPPVVSADGLRIAFARTSDDPAVNGLWLLAVTGVPSPTRLVSDRPQRVGSPPQPVAWSSDGRWLAIAPALGDSGAEIAVVDPAGGDSSFDAVLNTFIGGRARVLGPGFAVDWRGGERVLLITSSRTAFGGRTQIYTADVTTGATRSLYVPADDASLGAAVMHPSFDRYAVLEHPFGRGPGTPTAVWVRRLDGSATKVAESPFLSQPWWSRDGTKLFSLTGGDDSTGGVSNLLGTGGGAAFCRRGGTPPRCT
jgi:Tol biopolymer transport system component